jgi:hypothetical protein
MQTQKLALKRVLSVRCPMCGAPPSKKCRLSTGGLSLQVHFDREKAAARVATPDNFSQATMRFVWETTVRGFRGIFQKG